MGVAHGFWRPDGVVGDLGGGSVDLSVVAPEGRGPLWQPAARHVAGQPHAARPRSRGGRPVIDDRLDSVALARGCRGRGRGFYVVGGGWRALARVRLAMTDTP